MSTFDIVMGVNYSFSALSIIGESLMFLSYFRSKVQSFPMKLVISMTIFDFFYSIANFLPLLGDSGIPCTVQGMLRTATMIGIVYWATVIQIVTFSSVVRKNRKIDRRYNLFAAMSLLFALVPSISILISQIMGRELKYKYEYDFCTAAPDHMQLVVIGIPVWTGIFTSAILGVITMCKYKSITYQKSDMEYMRIMVYPGILVLCYLPGLVDRLYIFLDKESPDALLIANVACQRIIGLMNTIAYSWILAKQKIRPDPLSQSSGLKGSENPERTRERTELSGGKPASLVRMEKEIRSLEKDFQ